jgi:hypothetical protein
MENKPIKLCDYCGKTLHPIGNCRKNGKFGLNDWSSRKYHKKCLKELDKKDLQFGEAQDVLFMNSQELGELLKNF